MVKREIVAAVATGFLIAPMLLFAQGKETESTGETDGSDAAKATGGAAPVTSPEGGEGSGGAGTADTVGTAAVDAAAEDDKAGAAPARSAPPPPSALTPEEKAKAGTYRVRLRDLEDRINRLKEQIFRSKARLSLLAETVLDRKIAGSRATIVFRNEMGGSFRLEKATFLLDGGPIFNKSDENGSLAEREEINLFDGPVMPGDHTLSAVLHYRGHGYGIFSYLRGYSFKTRSSRTFTVNEGKALRLEVVGYEKGGVTTPLEEKPDIRYVMNVADYEGEAVEEEIGKE